MARSFEPADLIQLPKLDVASAMALTTALLTAAEAHAKLPKPIARAKAALGAGLVVLKEAAAAAAPAGGDAAAQTAADRIVDAAWSASLDLVQGWSKLPLGLAGDKPAKATALLHRLFPERLKFTQLRYPLEWAESETRMQQIDAGLDADFKALGAGVFVETLRLAHESYGKVLGLTAVPAAEVKLPSLREPLEALCAAMRVYVVKVTAHVDDEEPGSRELADELLRALHTWESAPHAAPAAADEPATPPAPPA